MNKPKHPQTGEVHSTASFPLPTRSEGNPTASTSDSAKNKPKKAVTVSRVEESRQRSVPSLAPGARFFDRKSAPLGDSLGVKPPEELSPDYISVDLPSGYFFYSFDNLTVSKSLKGAHQAKFNRAAAENSLSITAETVSSVLGGGVSALDLSIPDFHWLLLWLRLNCYGKVQMQQVFQCRNPKHVVDVAEGRKNKSTLETVEIIDRTTVKTKRFDPATLDSLKENVFTGSEWSLTYPKIRDAIALGDLQNRPDFAELQFLGDLAACIERSDGIPMSFEDRIKAVSEMDPDQIDFLSTYVTLVSDFGAEETIKTNCRSCSAEVTTRVEISAHLFSRAYSV